MRPTVPARAERLVSLVAALLLGASPLLAQSAEADSACTYERCALRFEDPDVHAGAPGRDAVVGRFGAFRAPDLRDRVARSDSARHYAGRLLGHQRRGAIADVIGVAMAGAALAMILRAEEGDLSGLPTVLRLTLASAVSSFYAASERREARRMLERTIWHYNAELPRGVAGP